MCELFYYIDLFQSEWQHETNIWEGLPCPLPFCIVAFHFKHSYCKHILLMFAPILPAFCSLLLPSYYSNNFVGKIDASLLLPYSQISISHPYNRDLLRSSYSYDTWYPRMYNYACYFVDYYILSCSTESFYQNKLFSSVQLNIHNVTETCAVVPVYYGHLEAIHKCPDYQGILIIQVNYMFKQHL